MGVFRKAFDSVLYAVAIVVGLFMVSTLLGVSWQFGSLFSAAGTVVLAFLIFTIIAPK
jgi:uncharacterized membrane protein